MTDTTTTKWIDHGIDYVNLTTIHKDVGLLNSAATTSNSSTMVIVSCINTSSINDTTSSAAAADVQGNNDTEFSIYMAGLIVCGVGVLLNIIALLILSRLSGSVEPPRKASFRQQLILLVNILICDVGISVAGVVYFFLRLYQLLAVGSDDAIDLTLDQLQSRLNLQCYQRIAAKFWDAGSTANLLALFLMSLDHFIAVRFSLKHSILMRKRVIITLVLISWVTSLFLALMELLFVITNTDLTNFIDEHREVMNQYFYTLTEYCRRDVFYFAQNTTQWQFPFNQTRDEKIKTSSDILVIVLVCLAMLGFYSYIAVVVCRISRARQMRLLECANNTLENLRRVEQSKRKGICTSIILLLTFLIIWLPYVVIKIKTMTWPSSGDKLVILVAMTIASCTSLLDILIYFLRSKEVSHMIHDMKRRNLCCGSHVMDHLSIHTPSTRRTSIPVI